MHRRKLTFTLATVLILAAVLLFAFIVLRAQGRNKGATGSKPLQTYGVEILTPTDGVDFQDYIVHFSQAVKRAWYSVMPESAQLGEKGVVILRLQVHRDGKIDRGGPTMETSSGKKPLDKAAIKAVLAAAPFEHFPEAFSGPNIEMRLTFLYNSPPPSPHHQ